MMGLTHAAISAAATSIAITSADPWVLGIAALSSQIPDLDTTDSTAGKILYPVAAWIEKRYAHRTATHCINATIFLAIAALPLWYYFGNWHLWAAVPLGHFFSAVADCFTKEGVCIFYPSPVRWVSAMNPNKRLRVGSTPEYWVLATAIAALLISYNIQTAGGLTLQLNQVLGNRDSVEQVLNKDGSTHLIYIDVQGVRASDRTRIKSRFFLVEQLGGNFLIQDQTGLYQTGKEIITSSVKAIATDNATTQIQPLTFNDEEPAAVLESLAAAHPGSAIYLSGSLSVDAPEELIITPTPGQFQSISSSGELIKLQYHPIELAAEQLLNQFATGQLTAKIVYPAPQL
ncbi:metal-dependent hydrolase [Coleofasciculus sp. FACHB-501]|uniref:metal-dependent hydrolase n=1 Tax=Cyanophyceae TaxID=3028117 RepID=UPI001F54A7A6|nr:metal-dependent hydrolase [Coleofasciculus sp. FACHB-501]